MISVSRDQSTIASYRYDPLGRLQEILRANGVNSTYVYDEAGRLSALQHTTTEETLSSFQYSYDKVGNRRQAIETLQTGQYAPTVQVTVTETGGQLLAGKTIYAFSGDTYTGYSKVTDTNGEASITLPVGAYRFRVDVDGTQFWSGEENHCTIGECGGVMFNIPQPVVVTVQDSDGTLREGLNLYAFDGDTYTNFHGTTNTDGQVSLRLPEGNYRFRADLNGTQFWSGEQNHCSLPGCTLVSMTVTLPVTVTVLDNVGMPHEGLSVYAFDGTTYTGFTGTTDADGRVKFTLPEGSYRFRADFNPQGTGTGGTHFWSDTQNHCNIPGCQSTTVTVTNGVLVTVQDTEGAPKSGLSVYAFDGTTYTGFNGTTDADGHVTFTPPQGSYRFRADYNGAQFWSSSTNHCDVPGCTSASVTVTNGLLVTVQDTDGAPKAGLRVYVFNGGTYTGFNATTNASGQVTFTLPQGSYHFRADLNGTQFWSGASNHCDVPGCGSANVTVSKPLTVTVLDTDGMPKSGLKVYAFNGATYTGYNSTTNANGQVVLTLPLGSYRFRADLNGTQFWSGETNHCALPGCESAQLVVSIPVTVTIQSENGDPYPDLQVYVFDGIRYTGYDSITDANGQTIFTLPEGNYRFRADYDGVQFWSAEENNCTWTYAKACEGDIIE